MKKFFSLLLIIFVGVVIFVLSEKSARQNINSLGRDRFPAAEEMDEDPFAHSRYIWMKLHDPATGLIPDNIYHKENEFVNRLAKAIGGQYRLTAAQQWKVRGPYNIGGRTKALALDIKNENNILAGGVSSGMWRSTDGGKSWTKTTAPQQLHSVSCIAQNRAAQKEHIWYYGTGEGFPDGRGGSAAVPSGGTNIYYRGDGIFKSVDNGQSWSLMPATVSGTATATDDFDFVWGLATFGQDGVYAATSTGLFKSLNGGASWKHVLNFGDKYPSTEIALTSTELCYATIGGAGPDNGIYKSQDGEAWVKISPPDWPDTTARTVIGIAPSNEKIVYFFTFQRGLHTQLRKYQEGIGWTNLTVNLPWAGDMVTYGGTMFCLKIKPDDPNAIFFGTMGFYRSTNGGQSFELIGSGYNFHVDQHSIVFSPSNPKVMIVGNDGGLFKTKDNVAPAKVIDGYNTIDWISLNNGYRTSQIYTVAIDKETAGSETITGGMQDNGCWFTTSTDPAVPWTELAGGDGGISAISKGGQYFYTSVGATFFLMRHWFVSGQHHFTEITPAATGHAGSLWLPPMILDAQDNRIMYLPWRYTMWRNSDLTQIPEIFPPTPTSKNWTKMENVTGHYTSALGMSKANPRRLYLGDMDGYLGRIDNPHEGQPVPVDIRHGNLPQWGYIHCITVDPFDANKVLVVYPNYGVISIYYSENGGDTWTPVSGNLEENPDGSGSGPSVRWLAILYVKGQPIYFVGTSVGLFSALTLNGMNTRWVQEGEAGIGNIVIDMIETRQSDGYVAVATHGNGIYSTRITEIPATLVQSVSLPVHFELYPAFPNPFNSRTTVRFHLPKAGVVRLQVFNMLGQEITSLLDGYQIAGEHSLSWDADTKPSGEYLIRLTFEKYSKTQKVTLQK